jgi:hypothetical protein
METLKLVHITKISEFQLISHSKRAEEVHFSKFFLKLLDLKQKLG